MRRALVTGAHGLVGGALAAALLARGTEVVVLERPERARGGRLEALRDRCAVLPGSFLEPEPLARAAAGCDAVFHLAAVSTVAADRLPVWEVNVRGTWLVLEAARAAGVERVLLASTARLAGERLPRSPYDASKAAAELVLAAYERPAAAVRLGNVYGPGDPQPSRLVPSLLAAARAGRPAVLRSTLETERTLLHADDAAAAFLTVADALAAGERPGPLVAAGPVHTLGEVVAAVGRAAGTALAPDLHAARPEPPLDPAASDTSALRALGWRADVALPEGLRQLV